MDIQAAEQGWYACPRQTCFIQLSKQTNIAHQTQEQKKCFKLFDRMFVYDGLQILSNMTIKYDQTAPNRVAKR